MTKTEARQWLRRIREDVADAENCIKSGDWAGVRECAADISGAAAALEEA